MSKEDHEAALKYYLAQYHGAKTAEARTAWAHLIASELPKLIDSIAEIEPMLGIHSMQQGG